jgi:hypothetical protein
MRPMRLRPVSAALQRNGRTGVPSLRWDGDDMMRKDGAPAAVWAEALGVRAGEALASRGGGCLGQPRCWDDDVVLVGDDAMV